MPTANYSREEIARRGQALYDRHIRPAVEPIHNGELIVINVETGEYEMDKDDIAATNRAFARFPDAPLFTLRVGERAAYRLAGSGRAPAVTAGRHTRRSGTPLPDADSRTE